MTRSLSAVLTSISPLLGGTAALIAGNNLLGVVLPLRMEAAGYPVALTGAIMAAYYFGLALGGWRGKRVILRIGHIRAFAAFAALAAIVTLAYTAFTHPAAPDLFMLAAALTVVSLIPVAMISLGEPDLSDSRVLSVKALYAASPDGLIGAAVAGLMIGSFYALGIVFASRIGLSVTEAAMFMSTVVLGGLAFQLPMGVLADRYDRRLIMSIALIAVGGLWLLLSGSAASGIPFAAFLVTALLFGGAMSSIYPLCVAETFDRLERRYHVAASGRLLMIHSIGATVGPMVAAALMAVYGPYTSFYSNQPWL